MSVSLANQEDAARATAEERAREEIYANDVNTLAQMFRADMQATKKRVHSSVQFVSLLRGIAVDMMADRFDSPQGLFIKQVFEDHGPQAILMALKQAYDHPEPFASDVVEHP